MKKKDEKLNQQENLEDKKEQKELKAKKDLNMVLPEISGSLSPMKQTVTASMFLNNKNLNVDNIRDAIDQNKSLLPNLGNNEEVYSNKTVEHLPFKRYNVPNNTIIQEGHVLKIINPIKKVFRVTPKDIEKIKARNEEKNNQANEPVNNVVEPIDEPKKEESIKVIRLGGVDTIVDIANKDPKIKNIIEEELYYLNEQEDKLLPPKHKKHPEDEDIPNNIKDEITDIIIDQNNNNNDHNPDEEMFRRHFLSQPWKEKNKPINNENKKQPEKLEVIEEVKPLEPIKEIIIFPRLDNQTKQDTTAEKLEPKKEENDENIYFDYQQSKPNEEIVEFLPLEDENEPVIKIEQEPLIEEPEVVITSPLIPVVKKPEPEIIKIEAPKKIEPSIEELEPVEVEYIKTVKPEPEEIVDVIQENNYLNGPEEFIQPNIEINEFKEPIEPIRIIEKDVIEEYKFVANRVIQPIRIIEKELVAYPNKYFDDEVNNIDNFQPNEFEDNTPRKLYRRLSEQEYKDKIITNWEANLPQKGELIYYPDADYAIEMIDIYKSFDDGKVIANNGVNLRVRRNNVHAIIGENGAGKSVLMSILFGIYDADSGIIKVNNEEVLFSSAKDAALKGIGMVHQHFKLVETDTIFENVILGLEDTNVLGFLKNHEARKKVQNLIDKYHFNLDMDKKVSELNVAEQQKTEILKLLYRDADILIFDEPTAVLSELEIKQFLDIVKQLKEDGKTIILITHKFKEIREVADRATIIRLGTFISEFNMNEKSDEEIISEMVGSNIDFVMNNNQGCYSDQTVFEVKDLVIDEKINNHSINFKINKGEIFAIAGVTGNGQSELALIIAGLLKNKTGEILINNRNINKYSVNKRYKAGLAYVPEDRHKYSIILDLPIYLNTVIDKVDQKPYSKNGFINSAVIKEYTRLFIKKNDIRGTSRGTTPIRNLSGGNQQKLVIAREMDRDYDVLVLEQPTRGLDIAAINKIHKEILEEKAKGKAILLISYELDEILSIADTVAVMNKYEIVNISNINDISREKIGNLMVGENA